VAGVLALWSTVLVPARHGFTPRLFRVALRDDIVRLLRALPGGGPQPEETDMAANRRQFLQLGAAAGLAAVGGMLPGSLAAAAEGPIEATRAPRPLRILILGGTGFTGPFQVRYAAVRGHHITVFNRGRRQADLPAGVEHLVGDRNEPDGLAELNAAVARGARWDAVIDNPTTLPFWVRDAGRVLESATDHFVFISTISVYADTSRPGMGEESPLLEYTGADPMAETMETVSGNFTLYGPLKAASEREAERWFPDRTTIIRPGLIVGPGDMSGRYTYWPVRLSKGGEVLAPGSGHDPVQFIDARDLAEWTVRMVEQRSFGRYNATGPAAKLSMAEMLGAIRGAFDGTIDTRLTWAPPEFLAEHGVRPWSDMPVWVPPAPESAGFSAVSIQRALDEGLTFRPGAVTARDTLEWVRAAPPESQGRLAGVFTSDRERAVLEAWRTETS
jgi:2'-hydroxyisoflavone reductase